MKKTILIITKHPRSKGGVVNYYNNFFKVFNSNDFDLKWFTVGSRPKNYNNRSNRKLSYAFEFLKDVFSFVLLLVRNRDICIVQVSPSFMPIPIIRDSIYLFIAKVFRKKTVTFIRGWSKEFENRITSKPGYFKYVMSLYKRSDRVFILANKFKEVLIELGFESNKISVTRTMYLQKDIQKEVGGVSERLKFLFIGRLSFEKGIVDILDAVKLVNDRGVEIDLEIYGHYANDQIKIMAQQKMETYSLENQVNICEFIAGKEKYKKLSESDVFLFPTYHDEGCPNSVIEALASGLFIISTPIGAIDEIVENDKNGFIIAVKTPEDLANKIIWCHNNTKKTRAFGFSNCSYASNRFEQKVIVNQISKIYNNIL